MRGSMANHSHNHNVGPAIGPTVRDRSPDPPMGRSGCCGGFLLLGTRKRGKRIVPATRMHDGSASSSRVWATNGAPQSGGGNQYASLSPSLLAPPSSPASFQNSAVQSSAQSPATFSVSLSAPSATSQIPLETTATMFQMGPYAHETALVSPPVFSTFTTAPSTAPFTPPPELATHVTTPSSPDVPFAQLLANSFGTKGSVRQQPPPTYSASPFASPDIFTADDLNATYQLYPGSPLAHLLSPTSGTGQSTPFPELELSSQSSPFPDLENPVQAVATMFFPGSPLLALEPAETMEVDVESLLLSQALNPCSYQEYRLEDKQSTKSYAVLERGLVDASKHEALARSSDMTSGRDSVNEINQIGYFFPECESSSVCQNAGPTVYHGRETATDSEVVQSIDEEDQETYRFGLLVSDDRSSSGASELADWKQSNKSMGCEMKDIVVTRNPDIDDRAHEPSEISSYRDVKQTGCTSGPCDQDTDDIVETGTTGSGQVSTEECSSQPSLLLLTENRVEADTEPSRSSRYSILEAASVCDGCDRIQHVWPTATRISLDTGGPQTGQKLDEQPVCGGESRVDCCGRCDELESRCDELTKALKQATQKLAGIEVKERIAIYREQQLKALIHWLQSGANSHQRCVNIMSDQLSDFGDGNVEPVPGQSTLLGSTFPQTCGSRNEADCIASNLIILETKIKRIVQENISTGDAGLRSDNSVAAISILSADLCYPGHDSLSSRTAILDKAKL